MPSDFKKIADDFSFRLVRILALKKRVDGLFLRRQEKRLQKRLATIWKKQRNWIEKNAASLSFLKGDKASARVNTIDSEIDEFVKKIPEKSALAETVVAAVRVSLFKGAKTVIKTHKLAQFGISFNLKNPEAIKFLGGKLSHELSNYRGNIHATTTNRISQILKRAADAGLSYSETAQQIREQTDSGVFSISRAEMISTHEIGIGYEKGNEIPMKDFSLQNPDRVVLKFWQTVADDRVTPQCKANEDQGWIDRRETFSSGDETAPRHNHPRCRCATQYKIPPKS